MMIAGGMMEGWIVGMVTSGECCGHARYRLENRIFGFGYSFMVCLGCACAATRDGMGMVISITETC